LHYLQKGLYLLLYFNCGTLINTFHWLGLDL